MGLINRKMRFLFGYLVFACLAVWANCLTNDQYYSMAQSTCAGLDANAAGGGWIYAVKRTMQGPLDCIEICADGSLLIQDGELVNGHYPLGKCITGLQVKSVTGGFPNDVMKLGPKIFNYHNCQHYNINFCCCKFG